MQGSYQRFYAQKLFEEHLRKQAEEQKEIEEAVANLPESFLEEDEGTIERPIILGDYLRRKRKAKQ